MEFLSAHAQRTSALSNLSYFLRCFVYYPSFQDTVLNKIFVLHDLFVSTVEEKFDEEQQLTNQSSKRKWKKKSFLYFNNNNSNNNRI